jgi:glycine/D-amino acid oxidase-like deaminating enzyme
MRRRQFLIGLGGLASGWPLPGIARQRPLRVGVVGAGILGSSIGLHLALAGADVTTFEGIAPAAGATRNSYAWLNAVVRRSNLSGSQISSIARWRWLDDQYSLGIRWGCLNWGAGPDGQAAVRANFDQVAQSTSPAPDAKC